MPSALKKTLLSLFGLLLLAAAGALWLVGSEAGTRLLTAQALRLSGDAVQWDSVEGTLLGSLELNGVRVRQPGQAVDIDRVALQWSPAALVDGLVQIDSLSAAGVRIVIADDDQDTPPASPFLPAELAIPLDITAHAVELRDLQLTMGEQPVQLIERIGLAFSLAGRELSLSRLEVRVPEGGLVASGSLALENVMPLQLELSWDWDPGLSADAADPGAPRQPMEPLSGALSLKGELDWVSPTGFEIEYRASGEQLTRLVAELPARLEAHGRLQGRYQPEELTLGELKLALVEMPLQLNASGKLLLPAVGEPGFEGRLGWVGVQWPLAEPEPEFSSPTGQLELAGTAQAYEFNLEADLAGSEIPRGSWQARGHGDSAGIELQQLQGELLDGQLLANGPLAWEPVPSWNLQLTASDIDPGAWLPEFPGRLDLVMASSGRLEADGLEAGLELQSLSGELLDRVFQATASAAVAGDAVELRSLSLESDGNQLQASGQVSPQQIALDWQLNGTNPSALLVGAGGRLNGSGTVRGTPEQPAVNARLTGRDLSLDGLSAPVLDVALQAGLGLEDALKLDLTLGPVQDGEEMLLEAANLKVRGRNAKHSLQLDLQSQPANLQLKMQGGLNKELSAWSGYLQQLGAVTADFGNWQLQRAAALELAADEVVLGESCLREAGDGSLVCMRGDWSQAAGGILAASLAGLPMRRLAPNFEAELSGQLAGSITVDGALGARASFDMSPGTLRVELEQGVKRLSHGGGEMEMLVGADGLDADIHFEAPQQGLLRAQLQLAGLNRWPMPEPQPLAGRVRVQLPDLGSLPALLPDLGASAGSLDADLKLAGTLEQPLVTGSLALLDGAADIPSAGLQLREIVLRADSAARDDGRMALAGGMNSGPGRVELSGWLDIPSVTLALDLKGERLQVFDTPDARVLVSPDMAVAWSDQVLRLRGELLIPEAEITPKLAIGPGLLSGDPEAEAEPVPGQLIAPSPDVVILGSEDSPLDASLLEAPFRLDNLLEVILGEKVKVNAMGFISRIAGAVTFRNDPRQKDLMPIATGRLDVVDGTFRAFGQDLDIETGQLIFSGVPVTEPELNVRAVRWIDNDPQVSAAGVLIAGPGSEPRVELFSRPQLDPIEVQSYLLTGTAPGTSENVLNIGTYLHPRFYVGYGYNLIEKTSEFSSLYTITPRYGLGVSVGEADNNVNLTFTHEH